MTKVTVSNPADNKVEASRIIDGIFVQTKTDGIVSLMFESKEEANLFATGFVSEKKKVAFKTGQLETMRALVKTHKLEAGAEMPGAKIIIRESTTPFYEGQNPKMNPTTEEVVTVNGQPVYREGVLLPSNDSETDSYVTADTASQKVQNEIEALEKEAGTIK